MIEGRRRFGILKLIIGLANHLKPEEYKNKEVGGGRGRKIEVVPKSEIINILLHQHLLLIQEEKILYLWVSELWEDNDDCQRRPRHSSKPCKSDESGDKDSAARRRRQDRRKIPKSNSCPIGNNINQHEGCTIRRSKINDPPSKFDSPSSHDLNGLSNQSHVSSSSRRSREVLMMTPPPPPPRPQRGTRILQSTPTRRSTGSTSEKDYEPITAAYARVNGIKYTHNLQYTDKLEGFGIYSGPLGKHYLTFCNGHSTP